MLESGRKDVHNREVYKHFCFSNIFPYEETLSRNSRYNVIFSTPDEELCADVFNALDARVKAGGESSILALGELRFQIDQVSQPFRLDFNNNSNSTIRARSSTPIIIRIPKWRYPDYGIESERPFEFWRESISLEAFVKQVHDGMEKKLLESNNFLGPCRERSTDAERDDFHERRPAVPEILSYRYVKSVSKPITVKGQRQQIIGSLWEFQFLPHNQEESRNLEFALDSGLGERNSLGFGFTNILQ